MLVELEELAVKALEHNRPQNLLYDAWLRKGAFCLITKGSMSRH